MWPVDHCYVLQPPPCLGQIVSVDGPFVVVDVSKNEQKQSLKVYMSKDVQLAEPKSNSGGGRASSSSPSPSPSSSSSSSSSSSTAASSSPFHSTDTVSRCQEYHQGLWKEIVVKREELSGPREETKTYDGIHPYDNNMDTSQLIAFPGAEKLEVSFHSRTVTESGCDYLTFGKVGTQNEYWGTRRYSGSAGPTNWPGVTGAAPLEINADRFELKFHSDGSCTYWGWSITVKAHYPSSSSSGATSGTAQGGEHAKALASMCTNDGKIQVLWQRHPDLIPTRSKLPKKSFKEPALVLTETKLVGVGSVGIVGGVGGVGGGGNKNTVVLVKSGTRTCVSSPMFMGGVLFDQYGSMLKEQGENNHVLETTYLGV